MRELYELKDKLCRELKKYNNQEITTSNLPVIDTLAHAAKNVDKLIDSYEEQSGYSNRYAYDNPRRVYPMRSDYNYRSMKNDDGYSYHGSDIEVLRQMMNKAPNEELKQHYQTIINRMETM